MMELKTLKDLEFGRTEKEDRKMLRQEAIKWIKDLEKQNSDEEQYTVAWIMTFFNITEEDLDE